MGAYDKVHELYLRSTKILTLITLPFTIILLALPGPILQVWLGNEYAEQGAVVLRVLGAATFLSAISGVATVTSLGVGQAWVPAAFAFASSGLTLLSNLVLVPVVAVAFGRAGSSGFNLAHLANAENPEHPERYGNSLRQRRARLYR